MCYGYDGEGALRRSLAERGMSRRSIVKGALGAIAGGAAVAAAPGLLSPAAAAVAGRGGAGCHRVPPGRISIQLYTLRDIMSGDGVDATIAHLGEKGRAASVRATACSACAARRLRSPTTRLARGCPSRGVSS